MEPTIILTDDPKSVTMVEEIFGPVLTVGGLRIAAFETCLTGVGQVYVYDEAEYDETLRLIDTTTAYALTGSMYAVLFFCKLLILISSGEASHRIAQR